MEDCEEFDLVEYFQSIRKGYGMTVFYGIEVRKGDDREAIKQKVREAAEKLQKKFKMGELEIGYYEGIHGDVWAKYKEYEERGTEDGQVDKDAPKNAIVENEDEDEL
jgi:hypothetical protein